jgi:hypothetical protein
MVASRVRCRDRLDFAGPTRTWNESSSRSANCTGDKVRRRAAASSIPSGIPSTLRQILAMAGQSSEPGSKSGTAVVARSRKSNTESADSPPAPSGSGSDATRTIASPSMPRDSRDVATIRTSGAASRIRRIAAAAPLSTCSQLSTIKSMLRPARWRSTTSSIEACSVGRSPNTLPMACMTREDSGTEASSTSHAPSGYFEMARRPASVANLVLPVPPVPVRTTRRWESRRRATSSSSRLRPMNDESTSPRFVFLPSVVFSGAPGLGAPGWGISKMRSASSSPASRCSPWSMSSTSDPIRDRSRFATTPVMST